ncbi:MAG: MarR family winged helix-turn-helix transcriptional regulator [Christensenellales bacterium]|jgi:DNA-binding MarR family transcriptional regulator
MIEKENEKAYSLFSFFHLLNHTFTEEFRKIYAPVKGLGYNHIKTLLSIRYTNYRTMGDISEDTGLEKGSFTAVANRLIAEGFIRREQSREDKRINLLYLTEKGKNFADELSIAHYNYMEKLLGKLTPIEREMWEASVKIMKRIIKKINGMESDTK